MLEEMLEGVLVGAGRGDVLDDESVLRGLCVPGGAGRSPDAGDLDGAAAWLAGVSVERIRGMIYILTLRFHLRNKAEQLEIARINRDRERAATQAAPRAESMAEAVATLARRGASADAVMATLGRLDIQPTLTAHPTEARRRAVLRKQERVAEALASLEDPRLLDSERKDARAGLRRVLLEMAMTDDVRSERLDAMDEVKNGLHYLAGSIWQVVPRLYDDLRRAIERYYPDVKASAGGEEAGEAVALPTLLRYRSWIGGDRDGNPKVTPEVTRLALALHRQTAVDLYLVELEALRQALTISTHRCAASPGLLDAINADGSLDAGAMRHLGFEPYRVRILQMQARLRTCVARPAAYTAAQFEADVRQIQDSLQSAGLGSLATQGPLADLLLRVRTFGLNLAALDVRQHSDVHEAAVDELLRAAGVCEKYAEMEEPERLEILRRELASPRPLVPSGVVLSDPTAMVMATLGVMREAIEAEAESETEVGEAPQEGAIGSYVVSMTHNVSDIFETLLLAKEAGLYRPATGSDPGVSMIDVAPLFETIDDLERAESLLRQLLAEPAYRSHLGRRGGMQEVMLGYSDSNKDGGYWVANWLLHRAQGEVSRACAEAGVKVRLFHGRGGTIGRGGGRANRAILAAPLESRTGRIRFTEQGEVISFRYAMPAIAHRHLEQIVSAMLVATHEATHETGHEAESAGPRSNSDGAPAGGPEMMERIAADSMRVYRSLIDDPAFWGWYTSVTPIGQISRLPLASRPVMRSPGTADFGTLRAIPWGFAWTQIRATVPGWFGVGAGLAAAIEKDPGAMDRFIAWNREWPIFGAIIANAEQEMARARLVIAERYANAGPKGSEGSGAIMQRVREEFEQTRRLILRITGSSELLDRRRVIQDLIRARNPDTDALNLCQIELLRRWREGSGRGHDDPTLTAALLASVNAIAAAMQSTG